MECGPEKVICTKTLAEYFSNDKEAEEMTKVEDIVKRKNGEGKSDCNNGVVNILLLTAYLAPEISFQKTTEDTFT